MRWCLWQEFGFQKLLDWCEAGDEFLVDESADGNHSQSTILDLIGGVFLHGSRVLCHSEGIKSVLTRLPRRVHADHLNKSWNTNNNFPEGTPEEKLVHGTLSNTPVVKVAGRA